MIRALIVFRSLCFAFLPAARALFRAARCGCASPASPHAVGASPVRLPYTRARPLRARGYALPLALPLPGCADNGRRLLIFC